MSCFDSPQGVRVLHRSSDPTTPLALCRNGESLSLRSINTPSPTAANDLDTSREVASVSAMVDQDPFPGFTMAGNQMIWLKNYGENTGLLQELEEARFVQSVGRTIKQGFVTFPLCILLLAEKEILQTCEKCKEVESAKQARGEDRFKRCGRCKRRYYCSVEHQQQDWDSHKIDCKDLSKLDFVSVENRKRRREVEGLEQVVESNLSTSQEHANGQERIVELSDE